jgi:DNA-binding transcriptional MerR regulator
LCSPLRREVAKLLFCALVYDFVVVLVVSGTHWSLRAWQGRLELMDSTLKTELIAGVTQTRLAELAGISSATLRNYEKEGLLSSLDREGKKVYDLDAFEALEMVKMLKTEGLGLKDIALKMAGSSKAEKTVTIKGKDADALRAEIEGLRAKLAGERDKLKELSDKIGKRVLKYKNEIVLTTEELKAIAELRQQNVRRALQVERRAKAVVTSLQYKKNAPNVIRFDLPQKVKPGKKRR